MYALNFSLKPIEKLTYKVPIYESVTFDSLLQTVKVICETYPTSASMWMWMYILTAFGSTVIKRPRLD